MRNWFKHVDTIHNVTLLVKLNIHLNLVYTLIYTLKHIHRRYTLYTLNLQNSFDKFLSLPSFCIMKIKVKFFRSVFSNINNKM